MMPPVKIFLLLIFSWAAFPRPLQAREEPPASPSWPCCVPARSGSRILFLGNSYTFFNRMPAMVKAMADTKGLRPDVHMHAAPAASLQSHWNDRRARSNMEGTAWDFVILQDPKQLHLSGLRNEPWSSEKNGALWYEPPKERPS